jgi:hypothetical protein
VIIYVAVLANIIYGYHPLSPLLIGREQGLSDQQVQILDQTIRLIPPGATIAAQYYIAPHINKPFWQVHVNPTLDEKADFILIHMNLPLIMSEQQDLEKTVTTLIDNGQYSIEMTKLGMILLKKK